MRTFAHMTLPQMMAEASGFRGELVAEPDTTVERIRSAASQLAYGATEAEAATHLVETGATPEEAFLAVKAGKVL